MSVHRFAKQALPQFLKNPRIRQDLYHASVPMVLAVAMAPSSLAGSAIFLLVWVLIRWSGHG
ncbi:MULTISPECIES: hypothetical protein [Phaeobacter]|uniref:hypothetical protein n=1 Tax=Phaeobacter TaxID=302485 RepID=UPI00041392B8|nr:MULTISPECIES: hypothetical protein [Phaeobacter]MDO6758529.1 hypothetical protein [Phaeobacter inhibens]